ncbi:protein argonaute MEL1-like isoform X1 [Asparagus officinalis]|uniref:protein argonaute MEL1-like isoform X1 n=1 Tax=Asparagus officinalis TaxID=4686 RepID=UPI00098E0912|nr:protein argonaute MEL1-like isoform X1 [Asparagus officinalis]
MEGKRCIVRANHFLVQVADRDLHHYDVAITPEVNSRAVCRKIISELVKIYKDSHLERLTPAYDGRKSLYTAGALPFTSQQFKIKLAEKERVDKEFGVTIKYAGHADLHHLQQFLHGRQFDAPQETIQVLDIVLRESPSQRYVTVARSFFSKNLGATKDIGGGLECWRGYYQSLRPTQMGLSLNIDTSATYFYQSIPVIAFAKEYLNIRDTPRTLTEKQRIALTKALRGIRVGVTHRDTSRRYKINGLSNEPLAQLMFPVDDKGNKKRVVQYFQEKYHCKLGYLTWPCLQSGSGSNPTHLPMVCKIVEGQRFLKKLKEKQVTEILRATCQRPREREESIRKIVMENNYEDDEYAQEFGIKVAKQLTSVEARVLRPPMLLYHGSGSGRHMTCNPRKGAWNMIDKKMFNGGTIDSWACVNFSHNLYRDAAVKHFYSSLFNTCTKLGMSIAPNSVINDLHEHANNVEAALRTVHAQATTALGGGTLQLLLIILPDERGSYGTIKRVCETELGLISQCCLSKHVQASKPQYLENVALKINVKVGGRNTVLSDAFSKKIPIVTDVPTIIFGADVTHPTAGDGASPSIAAVVASMDWPEVTKYKALISSQPHRQEMIEDLYTTTQGGPGGMIRDLLLSFNSATRELPQRIIFYRDGVSETQFSQVLLHEVDAIRKACQSLHKDNQPCVTFVVVQKRHHTRLFPETHGSEQADKSGNIRPGDLSGEGDRTETWD